MEFKAPFLFLISAKRNSGKSVLLLNLLVHKDLLYQRFDVIYVFSPTWNYQNTFDVLDLPPEQVFEEFDEKKIAEIIEENKEEQKEVLIIFDDCISSKGFKKTTEHSPLNHIATLGRHFNISLIIISQKLTSVSTQVRQNSDYIVLFAINPLETKLAYDTFCNSISNYKDWQEMVKYCTKDRYNFLFIDNHLGEFYHNFNKLQIKNVST